MKPYYLATIVIQNFSDITLSTVDVLTDASPVKLYHKVMEYFEKKGLQPASPGDIFKDIHIARQDQDGPYEVTFMGEEVKKQKDTAVWLFTWEVHYDEDHWASSPTGFTADMIQRIITYVHIFPAESESEPYCEHQYNVTMDKVEDVTRKLLYMDGGEFTETHREDLKRVYEAKYSDRDGGRLFLIKTDRPEAEEKEFYLVTIDKVIDGDPKAFPPFLTDNRRTAMRRFHEIKRQIEGFRFPVDENSLETNDKADFMEIYEKSNWYRNHYSVKLTTVRPE